MVTRARASEAPGEGLTLTAYTAEPGTPSHDGLKLPASLTGLDPRTGQAILVAAWYASLTALALAFAYRGRGLGRPPGAVIITGYLAFVSALAITITQARVSPAAAAVPAAVITLAGTILLARPPEPARCQAAAGQAAWWQRRSLLPGWNSRLCAVLEPYRPSTYDQARSRGSRRADPRRNPAEQVLYAGISRESTHPRCALGKLSIMWQCSTGPRPTQLTMRRAFCSARSMHVDTRKPRSGGTGRMEAVEVDVLVAGGGTAGVIAGLAAARNGAKTLIVERQRCLGGQFTAGSQGAWVGFSDKENRIVNGIAWELRNRLNERHAIVEDDPEKDVCFLYDPEVAKVVLNEMLSKEPLLTTYFNTSVVDVIAEGDTVAGLVVQSGMDQMEIRAKVVIDSSGDASVAAKAGVPFEIRPKKDIQPMTLIGRMAGVNVDRVKQHYRDNPPVHDSAVPPAWREYKTFPGYMHYGLGDDLRGVQLPPHLEYLRNWLVIFTSTPNPGEVTINCSGAIEAHSIAEQFEDRARQEIVSQTCLYDVAEAMRLYVPGFENAYLSIIASQLGVRESRRIIGDYKLTLDDFRAAREFEDTIGRGAMPAGAHTPDGVTMTVYDLPPGKSMTIPYRCMLPQNKEGLLVAGRCVSYEPPVANCIRNMAQCMVMGQAVGTAAAMAVEHGTTPRQVDIQLLQAALRDQGAIL